MTMETSIESQTKKRAPQRHDVPKSILETDEFKMYCFKVLPCPNQRQHDWKSCPFAHVGEKAARRDVRKRPYLGVFCDNLKEDEDAVCPRGENCPFAHNVFELWLHPSRYRTQLCRDGLGCKRKVCFFAHSLEDLRSPQSQSVPAPDASAAAEGISLGALPGSDAGASQDQLLGQLLGQHGNGLPLDQKVQLLLLHQQQEQQARQLEASIMLQAQALLQQQQQQLGLGAPEAAASYGWPGHVPSANLPPRSAAPVASSFGAAASPFGSVPSSLGGGLGGRANFLASSRQSLDIPRQVRPVHALPPRRSLDLCVERTSLDMPMPSYSIASSVSSNYSMASSMASFNLGSTTSYGSSGTNLALRQGSGGLYGGSSAMHTSQRPSNLSLATLDEESAILSGTAPASSTVDVLASQLYTMSSLYSPSSISTQQESPLQQPQQQQQQQQQQVQLPQAPPQLTPQQIASMSSLFMPGSSKPQDAASPPQLTPQQIFSMSSLFMPGSSKPSSLQQQPGQQQLLASPGCDAASNAGSTAGPALGMSLPAARMLGPNLPAAMFAEVAAEQADAGALVHSMQQQQQQQQQQGQAQPSTSAPGGVAEAGAGLPDIPPSVMQMLAALKMVNQQHPAVQGGNSPQ